MTGLHCIGSMNAGSAGFRVVLGECIDWFTWQVLGGTVLNDIPFCIGSEIPFRRIENDQSIVPWVLDHGTQADSNLEWPCNHLPARFQQICRSQLGQK